MRKIYALFGVALILAGCGGTGETFSVTVKDETTKVDEQTQQKELKAYYIDEPVEGVSFNCGSKSGISDSKGTIYFEDGKGCRLFLDSNIGKIVIRDIPANLLKDGVSILEGDTNIATFLKSIDAKPDNGKIDIDRSVVEALLDKKIESVPTSEEIAEVVSKVNQRLKEKGVNISLRVKKSDEAKEELERLKEQYRDKEHAVLGEKRENKPQDSSSNQNNQTSDKASRDAKDSTEKKNQNKQEQSTLNNPPQSTKPDSKNSTADEVKGDSKKGRDSQERSSSNQKGNQISTENKNNAKKESTGLTKKDSKPDTQDKDSVKPEKVDDSVDNGKKEPTDSSKKDSSKPDTQDKDSVKPEKVDDSVDSKFGVDDSENKINTSDMQALAGNWAGEAHYIKIELQLRKDGTYSYHSRLGIGKYHNYYRYSDYEGKWHLANGNSQVVLDLPNVEAPLVITNKFPKLETPAGVTLNAGSDVDTDYQMKIDQSKNIVTAKYTDKAKEYMSRKVADFQVDYFTMVAPKVNSEKFWSSVGILPAGYHYGHKLGVDSDDWKYAMERIKNDPKNYVMVISDENWQTLIGHRKSYIKDIQKPEKVYKWLEYFKDQMQILGKVPGTVLYIIAGDAPPYWTSDIRLNHNNDAKTISGKIIESRFPEVLERNPSNSWAGIFQMMDYLRMKYAPNVKLSYTLKTWGIAEKDIYHEPAEGWDSKDTVKVMADTINSLDANFDMLSFNFHPRSQHKVEEYEDGARYFGAISKLLKTRGGNKPKLWIWKISLWNKEQPKFFFTHIDFLVNECNAIGMTLGHGNDLTKLSGFKDDPDNGIYVKSWMEEYFKGTKIDSIPVHATQGIINWR